MGCEANTPSFKYVLVENLVITYNGIPYAIKTMYTKKKYIIWNINRPYQLEDSDIRPDESLIEYLIVSNENGIPTILSHDNITLSFDSKTNGSNGTGSGDYIALKKQVNENTNKYNILSDTVDGVERILGETSELEDGTIVYNLNKIKADSKEFGVKIGEIQTKVDDKYKDLKPVLLNDLVEYLRSVSEYKLSFTNIKEDIEITSDELTLINTSKSNMNSKLSLLQTSLDNLKTILDQIQDTVKSQLIVDAKTQLNNLNNALINICNTALLNNKIDGNEKSNIIQKTYELANYIGVVQNTCNNITVNGLGGVIYSVQNELLMTKDKTSSTINELKRSDEVLNENYSNMTQTIDEFKTEVSSKVTKMKFGATNLLVGSSSEYKEYTMNEWSSFPYTYNIEDINLKIGDEVIFRAYINVPSEALCGVSARITFYDASNTNIHTVSNNVFIGVGQEGYSEITNIVPNNAVKVLIGYQREISGSGLALYNFKGKEEKFEKGNKATEWSLSNQDILNAIDNGAKMETEDGQVVYVKDQLSEIIQNSDSISQKVSSIETEFGEGGVIDSLKSQVSTLQQLSNKFTMEFFEKIESSDLGVKEVLSYIDFSADGIVLGQEDYPIKLIISKDRIKFVAADGKQLAYFSDNKLLIEDSEILNTLIVSNYGFIPSSNGGLTIGAIR